jgi:hypothetical protein
MYGVLLQPQLAPKHQTNSVLARSRLGFELHERVERRVQHHPVGEVLDDVVCSEVDLDVEHPPIRVGVPTLDGVDPVEFVLGGVVGALGLACRADRVPLADAGRGHGHGHTGTIFLYSSAIQ